MSWLGNGQRLELLELYQLVHLKVRGLWETIWLSSRSGGSSGMLAEAAEQTGALHFVQMMVPRTGGPSPDLTCLLHHDLQGILLHMMASPAVCAYA